MCTHIMGLSGATYRWSGLRTSWSDSHNMLWLCQGMGLVLLTTHPVLNRSIELLVHVCACHCAGGTPKTHCWAFCCIWTRCLYL